ncbi:MAG TPA: hypothetical protein VGH47_05435 [Xanthobacteraceae bacterium]
MRFELPPDLLDVAQHPQLYNRAAARLEKCRAAPADFLAARLYAKKPAAVAAVKTHPRRRLVAHSDHLVDLARETAERGMYRSHISDEPVRPAQFGTERATEPKVTSKNSARFALVGLVPDEIVKPLYKLSRRRR